MQLWLPKKDTMRLISKEYFQFIPTVPTFYLGSGYNPAGVAVCRNIFVCLYEGDWNNTIAWVDGER